MKIELVERLRKYIKTGGSNCGRLDELKEAECQRQTRVKQLDELLVQNKTILDWYRQKQMRDRSIARNELITLEERLVSIKKNLNRSRNEYKSAIAKVQSLEEEIGRMDKLRKERDADVERMTGLNSEVTTLKERLKWLQLYDQLFHYSKIPLMLIKERLPELTVEINKIVSKWTKYKMGMEIVEVQSKTTKQTSEMLTVYVDQIDGNCRLNLENLCGYEKLIFNIAINRVISEINGGTKASLICIDETLDCMDERNFETTLPDLMSVLRMYYRTTVVISHRSTAHIGDREIDIEYRDGICRLGSCE
jgi:DNA repair exonuclease SbcCD ATPase subunit